MTRSESVDLAARTRGGDDAALGELIARHHAWVEAFVRRRLGRVLRRKGETMDFVQEALTRVLRYGPRIGVGDDGQFRALLAKIVENHLRDEHEYLTAGMRDVRREVEPGTAPLLEVGDGRREGDATPSADAIAGEDAHRLQLALELLDHRDRLAVQLRQHHGMPFAKIAVVLGVREDAVRKRHDRALVRMRGLYDDLEAGRVGAAIATSLGAPIREAVDRALREVDRRLQERLSHTVGESTRLEQLDHSAAVDRARRVFRAVGYDVDEVGYIARATAALREARVAAEAERMVVEPFDAAIEALARYSSSGDDHRPHA